MSLLGLSMLGNSRPMDMSLEAQLKRTRQQIVMELAFKARLEAELETMKMLPSLSEYAVDDREKSIDRSAVSLAGWKAQEKTILEAIEEAKEQADE